MERIFASSLFVFSLCALISRLESQHQTPHVYTKSPLIVNLTNEICCTCETGTDPTTHQVSLTLQPYDDHVSENRSASSDVNNTVCYVIEAMTVSYHRNVAACTATFATGKTTVKKTLAVFSKWS
ncbi:hypothetical protein V1264_003666 [Littorina saxatilis]|uniref:Uncharacterized protein n=1 Tax=Littorina saxatilis TaxID=31220 RepID=A0AAN9B692_9CAEN